MIKNLKKLRLEKGISQQKLADILGVSQQAINKYENQNSEPDIDMLIAMADYFGTTVDYLIGNCEEKKDMYTLNYQERAFVGWLRSVDEDKRDAFCTFIGLNGSFDPTTM